MHCPSAYQTWFFKKRWICLCPPHPREKGIYCFAPFCRSVGWSVNQAMSMSVCFYPLCSQFAKRGVVNALESISFLLVFRSHGQRLKSDCWSLYKWCPINIGWTLCLKDAKLGSVDATSLRTKYYRIL